MWFYFFICTGVIVYAGSRLSRYGDIIAEKTGLGRTWTGLILIAATTSLPEFITGISSVTYADAPDIAAGDVLGSCVFNLVILSFLDALYPPMPISSKAHGGNILSAGFGILILSLLAISMVGKDAFFSAGWVGSYSLLIIVLYLLAMRTAFKFEKRKIAEFVKEMAVELRYEKISVRRAVALYSLNAGIVIIAAAFLPEIGKRIAEETGLGQTFVGSALIALTTSLPEVVVSASAVRMDAVDLAVGNLFGSNLFNLLILALDDVFFMKGPILSFISDGHLISALSAIAMTGIAVIGLTYRSARKRLFLHWDSIGIILVYIMNLLMLYKRR